VLTNMADVQVSRALLPDSIASLFLHSPTRRWLGMRRVPGECAAPEHLNTCSHMMYHCTQ
jgi:hypothetical protein